MPTAGPPIPLEFLLSASKTSLMDFELSKLNHAALLTKRLRDTMHEIAEETALAILARMLIENEGLRSIRVDPRQESFQFEGSPGVEPFAALGAPDRFTRNAAD